MERSSYTTRLLLFVLCDRAVMPAAPQVRQLNVLQSHMCTSSSKIIFVTDKSLNESNSQNPKTKQSKMKSHSPNVKKYKANTSKLRKKYQQIIKEAGDLSTILAGPLPKYTWNCDSGDQIPLM